MPATYRAAGGDVVAVLAKVLKQYKPAFVREGVKIGILMAANPDGPAIKHGGYPAAAKVKVVPLRDRVSKAYDAEIVIDEEHWEDELRAEHRLALLHHEVCHLDLALDQYGQLKRDDLGRPKLKLLAGDWNGGDGFREVVEAHGDYALEVMNSESVRAKVKGALDRRAGLFDNMAG